MSTIVLRPYAVFAEHPEVLPLLAAIDARRPGLAEAISTVAQHESGWDPTARGTVRDKATGKVLADPAGLLQWIPATQRRYGVTGGSDAIVAMGYAEQLDLAERYATSVLGSITPTPWHLWVRGWGYGGNPDGLDSVVMYPPGSAGARANPSMTDATGAITLGKVRAHWRAWEAKQPQPTTLAIEPPPQPSTPTATGTDDGSAVAVVGTVLACLGIWMVRNRRKLT